MFDDLLPEEQEQAYNQLLAALRSAAHRQEPITAEEQSQIVTRVRGRLAQETSSSLPGAAAFTHKSQPAPAILAAQTHKPRRVVYGLLVAVVIIGLIAGSWAIFRTRPSSNGSTASRTTLEKPPSAHAEAGGLAVSMRVLVGGPYFLSELLPVDVSLTNHAGKAVSLAGISDTANLCFSSALMVQVTGSGKPSYALPRLAIACTQPFFITNVKTGQTLTIHQYVPLTRSGAVTLTMTAIFLSRAADPLAGHWPSVHIQVSAQIPPDRALSLQSQPGQVQITVPAGTKPHLLTMQSITCGSYGGSYGVWATLSTNVLYEPKSFVQNRWQTCRVPHSRWEYIISAPGYAIVSGSQTR
jgi:hypothetical protein